MELKWMSGLMVILAFCVVLLGAYTRLTDAGLGCPDWPGCYGSWTVPSSPEARARAEQAFPHAPVEVPKAFNEMLHRYVAGTLGLGILVTAFLALRRREPALRGLALALLGILAFQVLLGMWTVTMNLKPLVVMGHLMGGFTLLCLLFLVWLRARGTPPAADEPRTRWSRGLTLGGLVLLVAQIALGGWTSANYASLACTHLPFCQGDWWQRLELAEAFNLLSPPARTYLHGVLDYDARMTIHVTHRMGALLVTLVLGALAWWLSWKGVSRRQRLLGLTLAGVLSLQVGLGISNVLLLLPLSVAVAHNGVAGLLLLVLLWIGDGLWREA
jgi:heme a synthase